MIINFGTDYYRNSIVNNKVTEFHRKLYDERNTRKDELTKMCEYYKQEILAIDVKSKL